MSAMLRATSSTSSVSKQYLTSVLMISRTGVSGPFPAATARTLRDAALYLTRHGWVQGAQYDQTAVCFTPAACLVGAIGMVCYGGPVEAPAQHFGTPEFDAFEAAVSYLDGYLSREYGWC